jgi:hypothetical protein
MQLLSYCNKFLKTQNDQKRLSKHYLSESEVRNMHTKGGAHINIYLHGSWLDEWTNKQTNLCSQIGDSHKLFEDILWKNVRVACFFDVIR